MVPRIVRVQREGEIDVPVEQVQLLPYQCHRPLLGICHRGGILSFQDMKHLQTFL